jgi:hypothetical protein
MALGVAAPGLLVQMLWVDTSDHTKGKFVLNRSWTRRKPKGVKHGFKNRCKRKLGRTPSLPHFRSDIQTLTLLIGTYSKTSRPLGRRRSMVPEERLPRRVKSSRPKKQESQYALDDTSSHRLDIACHVYKRKI